LGERSLTVITFVFAEIAAGKEQAGVHGESEAAVQVPARDQENRQVSATPKAPSDFIPVRIWKVPSSSNRNHWFSLMRSSVQTGEYSRATVDICNDWTQIATDVAVN
jgi:hypothetical protein